MYGRCDHVVLVRKKVIANIFETVYFAIINVSIFVPKALTTMTKLEELIFSLSPAERKKLRPLQFRGVKRTLFQRIYRCHNRKDLEAIQKKQIDTLGAKRYYQLQSEILRSCYQDLIPEGGTNLLLYLANKQLVRLFHHELVTQEASHEDTPDDLDKFYEQLIITVPLLIVDSERGRELSEKFFECVKKYAKRIGPAKQGETLLRAMTLSRWIEDISVEHFDPKLFQKVVQELEEIFETSVKENENHVLQFYAGYNLFSICLSHKIMGKDLNLIRASLLELLDREPELFGHAAEYYRVEWGPTFGSKDLERSAENIKTFLESTAQAYGGSVYLVGHFIPKLLEIGEHEWVGTYIKEHIPEDVELLPDDSALAYMLTAIIFHIYKRQYEKGEDVLEKAFDRSRRIKISPLISILLKSLEVFFVSMRGDLEFAETLASRHLRYVRTYRHHQGKHDSVLFLKTLSVMIANSTVSNTKNKQILDDYVEQKGKTVYSLMLTQFFEDHGKLGRTIG
jgi:hypothetical protein